LSDAGWIDGLSEEALAFIRRFVLASGSLKEIAEIYSISYPTVRLRLDRLIEKIKLLKAFGADVIVMGRRGLSDFTGFFLGSISHKVAHSADCTVVTVK